MPWQLWLVDFGQPVGREQGGVRPAVVVSSAVHSRFPIDMALVVPLTSRDRGLEHQVRIDSPSSGLSRPSFARTEEITAVSTARFVRSVPLGVAADGEIARLTSWLREMVAFC
ncbi:type II toxin-antitoxin system PemK/MazF family toxin [Frankia sp. AgB32]|uniref:type II toxin-antitoxin system PemK/MazF family toxin n=1 Tax=Frankia sp. AgB32 TaxID=631119 RepID=UPI00200D39D3|nr:type II toxin-antitoxin system PemK/MazF family toxin [Frankia sp. AgB32]MCK9897058.1 type II toxin-antitoxin system PemK/MazF family toxin [Frankia sp. AgB32]